MKEITVVMPVYKVEKYVSECLDSIINQTFDCFECIIIDDCSPDNSMRLIEEKLAGYKGNISFRIVRNERNEGVSAARNKGIELSRGGYLFFIDSDDMLYENCLEKLWEETKRHPGIDLVQGDSYSEGMENKNSDLRSYLPEYLKNLTKEVENEGKRPMMWMDMLLEEGKFPDCYCTGKWDEVSNLRANTAKSTVFVDWQYNCFNSPIPSLKSLESCGHDCMGAPWYDERNYTAHINTVLQNQMFGIMLTTWHTLKSHIHSIYGCAKKCGAKDFVWGESSGLAEKTATLLRRVSFEGNNYEYSGWSKKQIEV